MRSARPDLDLARVAGAQQRFEAAVAGLEDAEARRPTRLPGWTVGHLLTHVARNADSHRRRAEAAVRGQQMVDQYAGGAEGRAAEIELGSALPAAELVADVVGTARALDVAWAAVVPDGAWSAESRDVGGTVRTLASLPHRRWRELEVHLVDLGLGPTHRDWSDEFVAACLPAERDRLALRLPAGTPAPPPGTLDPRDELAWLYGRLHRPDLPELLPWD